MKRALIITYYWPPNGGAGVQRWLKFAKYLPQHGWQPVIYTPENPQLVAEDPGLLRDVPSQAEVIKRPIREPYGLYKRLTGRKGERVHTAFLSEEKTRTSAMERLALWVRSNWFIPDARVGWVRSSVQFLSSYLKDHPVDVIITTGPPHSIHLIGLGLKKALGIRWIADFRDPWTNIDFYRQLDLSARADRKHRRLEREVLTSADTVIAVGGTLAEELRALGAKNVDVITNGYDPDDLPSPPVPVDDRWSLVHVGSLSATRNAPALWRALAERCRADKEFNEKFVLRFVGPVDHSVLASIEEAGLAGKVERLGSVDHDRALREMQRARALLLLLNDTPNAKGILTSKLFEYLAVGRPILAIGPKDGDVAKVLAGVASASLMEREHIDHAGIAEQIRETASGPVTTEPWSRRTLTSQLVKVLDRS